MITACWNPDPQKRPTFEQILNYLKDIRRSQFIETPQQSFNEMRNSWRVEIEKIIDQLKNKEQELRSIEDEIKKTLTQQKTQEEIFRKKERELMEREFEVLQRYEPFLSEIPKLT